MQTHLANARSTARDRSETLLPFITERGELGLSVSITTSWWYPERTLMGIVTNQSRNPLPVSVSAEEPQPQRGSMVRAGISSTQSRCI